MTETSPELNKKQPIEPHDVIDPQLEAYRKRDVEKFSTYYSHDIKAYRNGEPFIDGIADLKVKYGQLFETSPNLTIEIPKRVIEGEYVHDTELITGLRGSSEQIVAHVRYRIENSKITEVLITR